VISIREEPLQEKVPPEGKRKKLRFLIILGLFLDVILIAVFSLWIFYSKSTSEFDMLAEEKMKADEVNRELFEKLAAMDREQEEKGTGDVMLSISNMVLNKMSQSLFPLEFPLKGSVTGMVYGEELSDFQFVGEGKILFRIKLTGRKLTYNPRGNSMTDRMLGGTAIQEKVTLEGTGEVQFTFDREKQRLDLRYDIRGIDFKTGLPQFLEKAVKDRLSKELRTKPNYVELDFKPLKVKLGDKITLGEYFVTEVFTRENRLIAVADLIFVQKKMEE
jgi:hypothetical protein